MPQFKQNALSEKYQSGWFATNISQVIKERGFLSHDKSSQLYKQKRNKCSLND